MAQHQVIAAVLEAKGENEYLSKKRGLDFGIRNNFCANADNTGVNKIIDIDRRNVRQRRGRHEMKPLKYEVPSILDLEKGFLTEDKIEFFREHLDEEKMDDQVMEYWQTLSG